MSFDLTHIIHFLWKFFSYFRAHDKYLFWLLTNGLARGCPYHRYDVINRGRHKGEDILHARLFITLRRCFNLLNKCKSLIWPYFLLIGFLVFNERFKVTQWSFFYQLKEKLKQYWPDLINATINQGTFAIQLKSEKTYSHFTVRIFLLTNKKVWIQREFHRNLPFISRWCFISKLTFLLIQSQEKTARQCNFSSLRGLMVEHHILLISWCIIAVW